MTLRAWSDQLTAEAEATDDSKLAQQRQAYLRQVAATGKIPGLEGQTSGGAEKYLEDAQVARSVLNEIRGQIIFGTDGKPILADGSSLTYFGGTQAQRDDHNLYAIRPGSYDKRVSTNGSVNDIAPQQEVMLRSGRDASRLENLRATNGVALPDYPVETFIFGGGIQAGKSIVDIGLKNVIAKSEIEVAEVVSKRANLAAETKSANGQNSALHTTPDTLLSEADFAGRGVVRDDLANHLTFPSISGKQIAGGHDLNEFNLALNKAGGTVLSKIETGPGIYEIQYRLSNSTKTAIKTVYDPAIYPDMQSMANMAANKALLEYQRTGNAELNVVINGVEFFVPVKVLQGQAPKVPTVYPIRAKK